MNADVLGALENIDKSYRMFEHKGDPLFKHEVKEVLEYAISKGYTNTGQITEQEVEHVLKMKYLIVIGKSKSGTNYVAEWEGDPGRTELLKNAQIFNSKEEAMKKIEEIKPDLFRRKIEPKIHRIITV